jgi:hypothetical protein
MRPLIRCIVLGGLLAGFGCADGTTYRGADYGPPNENKPTAKPTAGRHGTGTEQPNPPPGPGAMPGTASIPERNNARAGTPPPPSDGRGVPGGGGAEK